MAKNKNANIARPGKGERVFGSPVRNLIMTALFSILIGAAFLVKPEMVYSYSGIAIGGVIGVVGLVYILIYFIRRPVSGQYRYEFAFGLVALLAGAYVALGGMLSGSAVLNAGMPFTGVVVILGVLVGADGILRLQYSIDLGRMRYGKWWIVFIFSLLGIALGVALVMGYVYDSGALFGIFDKEGLNETQNAFLGGLRMLGVALCLNGLLDLLSMIIVALRNHKASREAVIAEGSAILSAAKQEEMNGYFAAASAPQPMPQPVPQAVPQPAPQPEPNVVQPVVTDVAEVVIPEE